MTKSKEGETKMRKMMKKRMAIALTCTFTTVAVDAASVADEIKAAKAEIEANLVVRGVRRGQCRYYSAWFIENCTVAEREAILERNIAAHRKWIRLDPSSAAAHADLGCVYATVGRWKEAKPELEAAIAAGKRLPAANFCMLLYYPTTGDQRFLPAARVFASRSCRMRTARLHTSTAGSSGAENISFVMRLATATHTQPERKP